MCQDYPPPTHNIFYHRGHREKKRTHRENKDFLLLNPSHSPKLLSHKEHKDTEKKYVVV